MAKKAKFRLPYLLRIVRGRPRLFASALLGVLIALFSPSDWHPATRLLLGWNVGVWIYLLLVVIVMSKSDHQHIAGHAALQDEGRFGILLLTTAAAVATFVAIVYELSASRGSTRQIGELSTAIVTITSSWFFIHTIFALHYAHECYGERGGKNGGLNFPGDERPDYWDFVYFSFVIGMTAQVSDVAISSKVIRRTVTAHSIISFLFNVSLLALTINVAANVI